MLTMRWNGRVAAAMSVVAVGVAAPLAVAQEAEARALLEASAEAMDDVGSMRAKITLSGEGSSSFAALMPSAEGELLVRKGDVETGWQTRIRGESKARQDAETERFDIVQDRSLLTWIDRENEVVVTAPTRRAKGAALSMRQNLHLDEWLVSTPMLREKEASEYEVLEQQEIGGVRCDVVRLSYSSETGKFPRAGSPFPNKATFFLGAEDHLPRKVMRTTDADIVSISLVVTLTDVEAGAGLEASDFEIAAPEGYQTKEMKLGGVRRATGTAPAPNAAAAQPKPSTPARERAPGFEMRTLEGDAVTLEGQEGRVTVLYYWGTWCIPCREFSPLVSDLAGAFEGEPVDVFGPAVRSTERKVRETMEEKGYKHTALVDADGAARAHRVRVYPSIIVIDEKGGLVRMVEHGGGKSAAETVGEIETLVRAELERINEG